MAANPYQAQPSAALSSEDRERLILEHLPQVRLIARRIHERLPESVNLDDLISTGVVGLISAIDRFDASHNVKLKTYAEYKIRGAILDSLRGLDWAPRQQRKRSKQIEAAIAAVEQRLHRVPTEEEIAAQLGLTIEAYHEWLVEVHGLNLGSLAQHLGHFVQIYVTAVGCVIEPAVLIFFDDDSLGWHHKIRLLTRMATGATMELLQSSIKPPANAQ